MTIEAGLSKSKSFSLPPSLQSDPFWSETLTHSHSTFGAAPKINSSPKKDLRYNIEEDIEGWTPLDKFGVHHKRLQVASTWGTYSAPPAPGEYNPDHEKLSKREAFTCHSFPSKPNDYYFDELEFKKKNPPKRIIGGLPDLFAVKKSYSAADNSFTAGDLKNVSVEDMRKALLPGPGSYVGDYRKAERFPNPGVPVMVPRKPVAVPRKVVDFNTLQVLDMQERRQLFNGSYFSEKDPRKKNRGAHSFGYRRPMYGQPEDSSPGPGAYNVEPVLAVGSANPLSSTDNLVPRRDPPVLFKRTKINYSAPAKSFGRKNLIS